MVINVASNANGYIHVPRPDWIMGFLLCDLRCVPIRPGPNQAIVISQLWVVYLNVRYGVRTSGGHDWRRASSNYLCRL